MCNPPSIFGNCLVEGKGDWTGDWGWGLVRGRPPSIMCAVRYHRARCLSTVCKMIKTPYSHDYQSAFLAIWQIDSTGEHSKDLTRVRFPPIMQS